MIITDQSGVISRLRSAPRSSNRSSQRNFSNERPKAPVNSYIKTSEIKSQIEKPQPEKFIRELLVKSPSSKEIKPKDSNIQKTGQSAFPPQKVQTVGRKPAREQPQHNKKPVEKEIKKQPEAEHGNRVSRHLSLEERVKIYEKKYGKDFVYKRPEKEGFSLKGIVQKITSVFKKQEK
jgi:hypothetical protein